MIWKYIKVICELTTHGSVQLTMQKHANNVEGFRINKSQVKVIFVDETLLHIDPQDYWLWLLAYEPNRDLCLMVHYQEKGEFLYVISSSRNYKRYLTESSFS